MKKLYAAVGILILTLSVAFAQAPIVEWEKVIGGANSDQSVNIFQTSDGGYILGGTTHSFAGSHQDAFFIKLNADGDTVWTRCWGDSANSEMINDFIETYDGGYMAFGTKYWPYDPAKYYLLKLDDNCDSLWAVSLGDATYQRVGYGIVEAADNSGYVLTGQAMQSGFGYQILIVKAAIDGSFQWGQYYGETAYDVGYGICNAKTGYVVTGQTDIFSENQGDYNLFLMKTGAYGDTLWGKGYGGAYEECGNRVIETSDSGYIAVGTTKTPSGGYYKDWYIVRTDTNGDTLWTRIYGGAYEDVALEVKELPDSSGFVVAGVMYYGHWDACLLCLDTNGDSLWATAFGGDGYDEVNAIEFTNDGGFILCGQTDSYGADGYDIYVAKLSAETPVGVDDRNNAIPETVSLGQNYPNPFNATTQIKYNLPHDSQVRITIYNLLGQIVETLINSYQEAGTHSVSWQADDIKSGVYFYKLTADRYSEYKSMVLLK